MPFKRAKDSGCLKGTAGAVGTVLGMRQFSTEGNESGKPEDHGDDFHRRDHEMVREAREPDRGGSQIGNCHK